jgi:hypothetical protein
VRGQNGWDLRNKMHDSCSISTRDPRATARGSSDGPIDRQDQKESIEMPQDSIQGLYFMLGLLLAFYLLMPFLELSLR